MYTIYSRSLNRNEPVQGETIRETQDNYVAYRRRLSGTNFKWQYYAERGYTVVVFMPKKMQNAVNRRKLVSNN